jgi:hypothetical protein
MARPRRTQASIEAFTSVSKPISSSPLSKKRKQPIEDEAQLAIPSDPKKRKFAVVVAPSTPSKVLKSAFTKLNVQHSSPINTSFGAKRKRDLTPDSLVDNQQEFEALEHLCTSFLSTLSCHYAHNGSSSSVDLRRFLPALSKAWGERAVVLLDIRRVIGLMQSGTTRQLTFANTFALKDYGGGKVCIELKSTASMRNRTGLIFDDADLKRKFKSRLDAIWQSWQRDSIADSSLDWDSFLARLPLEPLAVSATAAKISALTAKGQRRLDDVLTPFKRISLEEAPSNRAIKRSRTGERDVQRLPSPPTSDEEMPPPPPPPVVSAADRSRQLLDRVRAKEELAASLPSGPTKDERERLAALQRAAELLQILNLLAVSKGGSRVSFPLPTLVANIKTSLRSPMSKEEILRCVKALQTEVVPGHVSVVTFGSVTGVVVDMMRKPAASEVQAKLRALGV